MKRLSALILTILFLVPSAAWAKSFTDYDVQQILQCENFVGGQASVTVTASTIAVTGSVNRDTKALHLYNSGANDVYVDVTGTTAVADTSHAVIRTGRDLRLDGFKTRTVSVITASSTSTIDFEACT